MAYEPTKQETKELYTRIWANFAVGHLTQEQVAELFQCSVDTVSNALNWATNNRSQIPSNIMVEAAKEALESRIREIKNDLIRIKESAPINWNAVIGMNKLIKENEELLWKLQGIIQDRSSVTIHTTQVNQVLKARDEVIGGMSDGQRQELIARIREIAGKQDNNQKAAG